MSAIPYHSDRIALKLRPLKTHPHRAPELRDGARTQALLERVNASRRVYLTHTVLDGRYTIRMVIGTRLTELRHFEAAWELIAAGAAAEV